MPCQQTNTISTFDYNCLPFLLKIAIIGVANPMLLFAGDQNQSCQWT